MSNSNDSNFCSDFLYFFVPFANVSIKNCADMQWGKMIDAFIVLLSMVWILIVVTVKLSLPDILPMDDLNLLVNVVTGSLGFLLPLYLSNAIEKNRSGVALYEAFCGDVVALAWQVKTYEKDNKEADGNTLFKIMKQMPQTIKHTFRGTFDYDKIGDDDLKKLMMGVRQGGESNPIEEVMFLLIIELRRLTKGSENPDALGIMMKKWNDIYGSYGTNASLIGYQEPLLFSYVLYTAIFIYVGFLPFSFADPHTGNNIWIGGLIIYFFLSLNAAGKVLQNPFVSLKTKLPVFATVSGTARSTKALLERINKYDIDMSSSEKNQMMNSLYFHKYL